MSSSARALRPKKHSQNFPVCNTCGRDLRVSNDLPGKGYCAHCERWQVLKTRKVSGTRILDDDEYYEHSEAF